MFARNRLITFKIALDTCPSSKYSDNSFPVVLQITYKRKVFRKRTGFRSIPENWDNERFVSDKRKVRNYKERNDDLNFLEDKALSILNSEFRTHFDYKKFSELLDRVEESELTFEEICNHYVQELYDQGRAGTASYYEDVGKSVSNYQENVLLIDITRRCGSAPY